MLQDYAALIHAHKVHVLDGPDGLIGVLVLEPRPHHLFIDTIAIHPAHHGQAHGRTLMNFAEDEARRRRLPEIRLYTHERMTETLPFYAALGFTETGRRVEDGYARVYFRSELCSSISGMRCRGARLSRPTVTCSSVVPKLRHTRCGGVAA
jgi:ribosomal protein S18 acetylase RimI-like enzyme